ncbi:sulfite exporter TauE/SafE family protein [Moritella sp. 24]|uniref:sulfite exporter TauE/SafE family protein n=1 Tax=Moritella sp. 24 TaxID=2746230 RepID=UPI001BAAB5C3|nr:sulfite exporter TauE/SafE family protein [Moritella sp. 24]QUM76961.1 sulfite exporter TauE/SafE family protein [Moritella sp. 24]
MLVETLVPFMAIIAVATYVQSIAGFALGMIVMGTVTSFNLVPIAFTSVVISTVTLMNSIFIIKGCFSQLNRRIVILTVAGMLPGMFIGLYLLEYLSGSFNEILQTILGIAIIGAGISMILKSPHKERKESKKFTFLCAGTASGILNGMFSMGGPPLVYIFYRQPFTLNLIRLYLLSIFFVSSISRLTMVGLRGELTADMLIFSAACIPVVLGVSWIAKHYPPPISLDTMRKFAFCLLMVIGSSLLY